MIEKIDFVIEIIGNIFLISAFLWLYFSLIPKVKNTTEPYVLLKKLDKYVKDQSRKKELYKSLGYALKINKTQMQRHLEKLEDSSELAANEFIISNRFIFIFFLLALSSLLKLDLLLDLNLTEHPLRIGNFNIEFGLFKKLMLVLIYAIIEIFIFPKLKGYWNKKIRKIFTKDNK
ncbi:MAG: hypothetical protein Q4D05_09590 [Acinetobacter sp.]|nr:hypothetical protein [Acinetobacter sp.]